jgi:hypothetical protein
MSRTYGHSDSNRFSQIPSVRHERSSFNRSHGHKFTCNAGFIIPIFLDEVLPGDTFNLRLTALGRMTTPIYPIMDNVRFYTHFFFTPNRLVWDNWERFNGAQDNPGDTTDYTIPQTGGKAVPGNIYDYFALPIDLDLIVSALPFRAHNLIYNEYFRDENISDSFVVHKGDGPDSAGDYELMRSRKVKDYFTSCLPWPQKGTASFINDIGNLGVDTTASFAPNSPYYWEAETVSGKTPASGYLDSSVNSWNVTFDVERGVDGRMYHDSTNNADNMTIVSTITGSVHTTVNALREAFAIQKALELDARGGTRYFEILRAHFGVISPDARMQRPEYLGGGISRLDVTQIAQTSATVAGTPSPQGHLAGFATAELNHHGFKKSFVEHGHIHGYMIIRADLTYQQGVPKIWTRKTKYDYFWPSFSHLGEQAVLQEEIYATGNATENAKVFGYQERYAEYRYKPSTIVGKLRSNAGGSLDAWHLSQYFTSAPTLSEGFIQDQPPFDRVVAVPSEPHFIFDCYFRLICARPMPVYSVPGSMDSF